MSKQHNPIIKREVRYIYTPVQEHLTNEEQSYVSYGLSVRMAEQEIAFVSDLSTDFEAVQRLAMLCTEQELSPDHLEDVIEDFLADESLILS